MADFKQNYFQRRTKDRGPRSNNRISSPDVQVIGSDGENLGVINTNFKSFQVAADVSLVYVIDVTTVISEFKPPENVK